MSDINLDLDGLVWFLVLILFGPAILFTIIGGALRYNKKKKSAKVFFILAVVYVVISLGICVSMII